MLLWINGPFGGGKTQTAHELHRRLANSVVCDPEQVGFGLHRMSPRALRNDFQDLRAWRSGVVEVLDLALREDIGVVIAPMTLTRADYFEEVVGELRSSHDVRHVALLARPDTVRRRLRGRSLGHVLGTLTGHDAPLRRESFAMARVDDCLERLADDRFATHVWTDDLTVPQVAEQVAQIAGLRLAPSTDGPIRARARTAWVGVRHLRLR